MTVSRRWVQMLSAAVCAVPLVLSSACASKEVAEQVPFSESLISDYSLNDDHKKRLQYFLSGPITLVRSATDTVRGIAEGRLVDQGGRTFRQVDIPSGAPGVVVGSGPNWMAVSFSPGSWLYFVSNQPRVNSPYYKDDREGNRYYLYTPDWDGRAGTVKLGDYSYQAIGKSIDAYLIVDRESLFDTRSRGSTLSGRWLDGRKR